VTSLSATVKNGKQSLRDERMYSLDANIFVRDFDPRDPGYESCHTLIERLEELARSEILPVLVLAEVAGSISRTQRDPVRGRLAAESLIGQQNRTFVDLDLALAEVAAQIAADCGLRGADAVYVAVAQRYGTTLITLDTEVRQRAGRLIRIQTPREALESLSSS
jgi:predicted nucleic acid-binding protein